MNSLRLTAALFTAILLAVTLLASAIDFGTDLPTAPILTGPNIVDKSNIEATLAGVAKGAR